LGSEGRLTKVAFLVPLVGRERGGKIQAGRFLTTSSLFAEAKIFAHYIVNNQQIVDLTKLYSVRVVITCSTLNFNLIAVAGCGFPGGFNTS
jgi:hypothetical protein